MRSQEEIIARAIARSSEDFFGFEVNEYLRALTTENLEGLKGSLINEEADLAEHEPDLTSDEKLKAQCIEYMSFAWDKANGCRGISASRSLYHYKAWLWMLGEDQFEEIDNYQFYGKDELVKICHYLDLDPAEWDDGVRTNG